MTIYSIVRGTGYLAATQVSSVPKTLFAIKIRSYVPHILHPLVLWTQVVPPLEYGSLVASTLCGDKAEVTLGPTLQRIQFTSDIHIPLKIDIHSEFNKLVSVSRLHHLYALGDDCVERRYNTNAWQYQLTSSRKSYPAYTDAEDPKPLQ